MSEIQVNATQAGDQKDVQLTATPDGGFVAMWRVEETDANGHVVHKIMVRKFDGQGVAQGGEVVAATVPTLGTNFLPQAKITALDNGQIALAWLGYHQTPPVHMDEARVHYAVLNGDAGLSIDHSGYLPEESPTDAPADINIMQVSGGGFGIGYFRSDAGTSKDAKLLRFVSADGVLQTEIDLAGTYSSNQSVVIDTPVTKTDPGGGDIKAVTYVHYKTGYGLRAKFHRYDNNSYGDILLQIAPANDVVIGEPAAVYLSDPATPTNELLVVWSTSGGVFARFLDLGDSYVGADNVLHDIKQIAGPGAVAPQIDRLPNGEVRLVWEETANGDADIKTTTLGKSWFTGPNTGLPTATTVNAVTADDQTGADTVILANGDVVTAWTSESTSDGLEIRAIKEGNNPPLNSAPEAFGGKIILTAQEPVSHSLRGTDAEGDALVYQLIGTPDANGWVSVQASGGVAAGRVRITDAATGAYEYDPQGFQGNADFQYQVSDPAGLSSSAVMNVDVTYDIGKAVQFDGSTGYLSRTVDASGGNQKTFTISAWVKSSASGISNAIISGGSAGAGASQDDFWVGFGENGELVISNSVNNSDTYRWETKKKISSASEYVHVVVRHDTTQTAEEDRLRVWIDGKPYTGDKIKVTSYPDHNANSVFNSANLPQRVGAADGSGNPYRKLEGHLAEVAVVDGQALDHTAFGFEDVNEVWHARKPDVDSYGNQGFYLNFSDKGDLGKDSSGKGAIFTVNGGVSQTTDTPTGNAGKSVTLNGTDGNDVLEGSAANDALAGGAGADSFRFNNGGNRDRILDAEGDDKVSFGADITKDEVWFTQAGDDLVVRLLGSNDSIAVADWFDTSGQKRVGSFELSTGETLSAANVQTLVQAMSQFTVSDIEANQVQQDPDYDQAFQTLVNGSWSNS